MAREGPNAAPWKAHAAGISDRRIIVLRLAWIAMVNTGQDWCLTDASCQDVVYSLMAVDPTISSAAKMNFNLAHGIFTVRVWDCNDTKHRLPVRRFCQSS
jgi:hypothetical protein